MNRILIVNASVADNRVMSSLLSRAGYDPIGTDSIEAGGKENNKLFMVIPGASHTDLYDQKGVIPFNALTNFFNEYLK